MISRACALASSIWRLTSSSAVAASWRARSASERLREICCWRLSAAAMILGYAYRRSASSNATNAITSTTKVTLISSRLASATIGVI